MNKFLCNKELITHIAEETRRVMRGSAFQDNFYLYHNALSLMAAAETRNWMRKLDYERYLLLPMKNLNIRTISYHRKVLLLDCSFFIDLHASANRHVSLTHLLKNDLKKSSLVIPKVISWAYCWLCTCGGEDESPSCSEY